MTWQRAGFAGTTAVLVLALSSCGGTTTASKAPPSATPSPSYYASGVPYVDKGRLYVGHQGQPGEWVDVVTAGSYAAAIKSENDGTFTLVLLRDGKQVRTVHHAFPRTSVSPDGTKLAWTTLGSRGAGTLFVLDLNQSQVLGRLPVRIHGAATADASVGLLVRNSGALRYEIGAGGWRSWTPGGKPVRIAAPVDGYLANPPGFNGVKPLVRLSPDHLWGAWVTRGNRTLEVQKPGDPGSRFTIRLPRFAGPALVGWDSPTVAALLLPHQTAGGQSQKITCDVNTRTCSGVTGA